MARKKLVNLKTLGDVDIETARELLVEYDRLCKEILISQHIYHQFGGLHDIIISCEEGVTTDEDHPCTNLTSLRLDYDKYEASSRTILAALTKHWKVLEKARDKIAEKYERLLNGEYAEDEE